MVVLHDDANTTAVLIAQKMAALERCCSVCEAQVEHRSQLDASGRCVECQP